MSSASEICGSATTAMKHRSGFAEPCHLSSNCRHNSWLAATVPLSNRSDCPNWNSSHTRCFRGSDLSRCPKNADSAGSASRIAGGPTPEQVRPDYRADRDKVKRSSKRLGGAGGDNSNCVRLAVPVHWACAVTFRGRRVCCDGHVSKTCLRSPGRVSMCLPAPPSRISREE